MNLHPTFNTPRRAAIAFPMRFAVAAGLLLWGAASASAKIDLVTLPERASTQLTIYNDVDLTLVRESRVLTFREGVNQIQFSWANTLIDPTSLQLIVKKGAEKFSIRDVTFPGGAKNTLIWNVEAKEAGAAEIEILYFTAGISWQADFVGMANADETEMRVENFVSVTNNSGEDFEDAQVRVVVGAVSLRERIGQLAKKYWPDAPIPSLSASPNIYRFENNFAMLDKLGKDARRDGETKSEMLYWAYGVRAASGTGSYDPLYSIGIPALVKVVVKEALAEFQLYTIDGTEDLKNGWSRRLRAFAKDNVKIEIAYEQDERKYGQGVTRLYRSRNDVENKLGAAPLPGGMWRIFREIEGGGAQWVGSFEHKYVPAGEKIELNLGNDGQLTLEPKLLGIRRAAFDFRRDDQNVAGYDEIGMLAIGVRNASPRPVAVKLVRHFDGDWTLEPKGAAQSMKPERRDDSSFVFETTVPGGQGVTIDYDLTTRKGTNNRRAKP